jgi:hypothetical protein
MPERSGDLTAIDEIAQGLGILGRYTVILGVDAEVIYVGDAKIHDKLTAEERYRLRQLGWCSGKEDQGKFPGYFIFV